MAELEVDEVDHTRCLGVGGERAGFVDGTSKRLVAQDRVPGSESEPNVVSVEEWRRVHRDEIDLRLAQGTDCRGVPGRDDIDDVATDLSKDRRDDP
jgi:hypothetical protein